MKRKGLISLGHTLFSNVINFNKKSKQPQVSLPLIYAGSWQFTDELSNRTHCLEITTDLRILIDHRELAGQVQTLTAKELIFLDGYGYHLRIDAVDSKPISVYDEADNRVYELVDELDHDTPCL
ncbi:MULTISPECIES: DUF4828 domain-containing protein [Ligilactobacillus]|uniref:DUF4828 domain-containing protein n=1 Tax=Ligilactobacillus animalis TaxID=1605 RepID=A0AAJ6JZX8_9LACO|nr:DUF4828 domain-containing protein [Ligilactobacillus animalis]KDA46460.1 hypothetical protein Lani381_0480 [Ligilactobacillus animalis]MBU5278723.1 DUF4828 domain-containing protein [Ligilactobacillus animalis]MDO5882638.1 DUF4828 domain-containing protein [Ligilactobacillus animalis]MDQ2234091.1 DUF4828 domain-containing protein [Ligilactobacillus animalis]MDU1487883.1 DUF4828 domain-containing protein [Ligilactobacillus animalis]